MHTHNPPQFWENLGILIQIQTQQVNLGSWNLPSNSRKAIDSDVLRVCLMFFIITKLILLHDSLLKSIKSFGKVAQPGTGYALAQMFPPLFQRKFMEELQLSV